MNEPPFMRLQRAFAAHLRDPGSVAAPGAHEERRLDIYRYAVFHNVAGLMSDNYPRVRAVMDDARWTALVRDYIVRHQSRASAFVDVPREFLAYLDAERSAEDDPAYIAELAHFDWLETLVGADTTRVDCSAVRRDGDLLDGIVIPNPTLRIVVYRYPVHAIGPDYMPSEPPPQPTCIAAFRDPDNLYGFLDLNAAARRLLECIAQQDGRTGRAILDDLAVEFGYADVAAFAQGGITILERMRRRGAVLGARTES